jgi:serine/threonine-protein kinase
MANGDKGRIGAVIGGRYRLLSVMGSGGMGVVYRAEHLVLKKEMALKVLHSHLRNHLRGPELRQRFLREAESLARMDRHPHMVEVVDGGATEDGTLYIAMELCEGEALCEVLGRGPLPPARALHITVQVLRALVHAHGRGVIHRDLKPDNIMLVRREGREDFVKVLDFGIAKLLHEAELGSAAQDDGEAPGPGPGPEEGRRALTQAGVIFGTPEYLAPEQAGGKGVDQRTDLYAVGVILWEMLVGRRPFEGQTPLETISQQVNLEPEPPSLHCATPLPRVLDELVLRAMSKDPAGRPASAEEFLREIDVALRQLGGARVAGRLPTQITGLLRTMTGRLSSPVSAPQEGQEGAKGPRSTPGTGLPAGALAATRARARAAAGRAVALLRAQADTWGARLGVRGTAVLVAVMVVVGFACISHLAIFLHRRLSRPAPAVAQVPARPEAGQGQGQGQSQGQVPLELLLDAMEQGRSCQERRSALLALMARRDPRALPSVQAARKRAVGKGAKNGCMLKDLDTAIELMQPAPPGPGLGPGTR